MNLRTLAEFFIPMKKEGFDGSCVLMKGNGIERRVKEGFWGGGGGMYWRGLGRGEGARGGEWEGWGLGWLG